MPYNKTMFGAFGNSVATLRDSAFFRWFSLEPETSDAGAAGRTFRPSGRAFHDLVAFTALTAPDDKLCELHLSLARSFIDDPRNGAFALDITNSFLGGALGETALVIDLQRRLANSVDIRRADVAQPEPVALSDAEEQAVQTYAGLLHECDLNIGELTLRMQNEAGSLNVSIGRSISA